ncbi:hypothetical protein LOC59_03360 [Arthrobacter sp. zg-Y916]|uniref:hypothetical protein n=1 Tax=Arthrobacter sp. zg-Y916 TaxID=2894190 RepID=UPI001E54F25E|nr:hypothetical protein [Arthrobacter sp. zg-Y916]MCC9192693.1 hypothetical protein [Arthrobacter sp. zg-Y916]
MAVDTSGLFGWPSSDSIESAYPSVEAAGEAYLNAVEETGETWKQLGLHYSGDGGDEMVGAFRTVMPHAEMLEETAAGVKDALVGFAAGIRTLEAKRDQLMARIQAASTRASDTPEGLYRSEPNVPFDRPVTGEDLLLPAEIAGLAARYRNLEEETAARLRSAYNRDTLLDNLTSIPATIGYGTASGVINRIAVRQTTRESERTYLRYDTTEERQRHMARGRWMEGERKARTTLRFEPRPAVSRMFYNNFEWYRARVDANPSKWVKAERFGDLTNAAKSIKLGGGAFTLVTAGFTIADEREDAYNELLHANPTWSRDELEGRANLEGGVKGGTKVGIDLVAAGTGAAIGTAIGGPVGTVVGAGIGIGISVITSMEFDFLDGRTIKDAAADRAMEAIDNMANGWNKLFGG